jgi:predicted TIM-barrel fold metal-dependent hydrolase
MTAISAIPWPSARTPDESSWTPPAGTTVVSVDDHVLEPPGLWQDRLPAADRDRAPRIWKDAGGTHLEVDGRLFDTPGQNLLLVQGREGFSDLGRRLEDMDAEGLDIAFMFSQVSMALYAMQDKELMVRCFDVYNEWLAEWCAQVPGRFFGVGILPTIYEPAATADYLQKLKAWGYRAVQIPSSPRNVFYNSSGMKPLWSAVEASGMPLSFHIGENPDFKGAGALGTYLTVTFQPFRKLWALLAFSGVLERHPEMNVIFTEGGISWVPSALYDADKTYREFETEMRPKLAQLPSYYWHRQCYATFMDDPSGIKLIDDIGYEHVMWSADYPHPESTLGESRRLVQSFFNDLGEERAKAIVGGNAERLYRL